MEKALSNKCQVLPNSVNSTNSKYIAILSQAEEQTSEMFDNNNSEENMNQGIKNLEKIRVQEIDKKTKSIFKANLMSKKVIAGAF